MILLLSSLAASVSLASSQPVEAPTCIENPGQLLEADINNDGVITRAEVEARRADIFGRLDRSGDGVARSSDAPRMARQRYNQALDQLLAGFDANGDGELSRDEFVTGPTPGFDRADANENDQLDPDELVAVEAMACDAE